MENQTPNANENVQPTAAQTELSRDEKKELYFNTTWVDIESKSTEDLTNLLKDIDGKVDFVDQKIFFNQAKDLIKTRAQEAKAKKLEAFLEAGNLGRQQNNKLELLKNYKLMKTLDSTKGRFESAFG
ncbi:MAG: hypothetical protein ACPGEC_06405, partial [Flavobacteriales bacterium]